ncbi:MAG: MFS transporter [Burkholderiales bacterium]|nr:MFS transporter [Burkholderiales bacterium]
MPAHPTTQPNGAFPFGPLAATMSMQTAATMAAYSVPSLAPVIAHDLRIDGALSGYFVSLVYGVGIVSSLAAANLIHRFGAVRVSQLVLLAAVCMLAICASGHAAALALGAVVLGMAYGATAPVSAHLLVPRTPVSMLNLVLSVRQIGVPLGGVLAALALPPLALNLGWQATLLMSAVPIALFMVCLQWPRRQWDAPAQASASAPHGGLAQLRGLLASSANLRRLTLASFVFQGVQLCFVAFMTVQLTERAGFGLIAAAQALALFQVTGVVSRPLWGALADRIGSARGLLAALGFVTGAAAIAAGFYSEHWPAALVLVVTAIAGASANGTTGLAYAEFARLGGPKRTEATGLGSAAMFSGVLVLPSLGATLVTATGSYLPTFAGFGVLAMATAVALARPTMARG